MPQGAPRWHTALLLLLLALLLHGALLAGASRAGMAADAAPPGARNATPMLVRTLPGPETETPATLSEARAATAPDAALPNAPAAPVAPAAPAPPPATVAQAASAASAVLAAEPVAPAEPAAAPAPAVADAAPMAASAAAGQAAAAIAAAAPPEPAPVAASPGNDIPVYKTVFPPPLTLTYDLRRGVLGGTGTLRWRPAGARYEARLDGRVAGVSVLTQVSQGGFDDAGIAPERYTDQRLGSAVRAANFQRERGLITFSGPSNEFSLLVGAQDRLSWMVQLAAVVSAEPQRLAPGGKVALYVVGARADASVWVFRSAGEELLDTPLGPVRAVKFSREARGPYDTQADAWLDPARHGLPVKARLGTGSSNDGEALELLLREVAPG